VIKNERKPIEDEINNIIGEFEQLGGGIEEELSITSDEIEHYNILSATSDF